MDAPSPEYRQLPKLSAIHVEGLLGRFDHAIVFDPEWEFVIVHGPNGVGKTRLLELTYAVLRGNYEAVRQMPFEAISLTFDDGETRIRVVRRPAHGQGERDVWVDEPFELSVVAFGPFFGRDGVIWQGTQDPEALVSTRAGMLETMLPIERVGPSTWRDLEVGDYLDAAGLMDRYRPTVGAHLPESGVAIPLRLEEFHSAQQSHLIETHRLRIERDERAAQRARLKSARPEATVSNFAADLAGRISRALAANTTTSQRLDRTFPNRLMDLDPDQAPSQSKLQAQHRELEELRDRLVSAALIDPASASLPGTLRPVIGENWKRQVLSLHLADTAEKLATYEDLLRRIETFRRIINRRFDYKTLQITRQQGFIFTAESSVVGPSSPIPVQDLSSGEQHELVMMYDLLFNVSANSIVLIDEPEISLHVEWQMEYLSDLLEIARVARLRFVIATHSPHVVGDWWPRTVRLGGPRDL